MCAARTAGCNSKLTAVADELPAAVAADGFDEFVTHVTGVGTLNYGPRGGACGVIWLCVLVGWLVSLPAAVQQKRIY